MRSYSATVLALLAAAAWLGGAPAERAGGGPTPGPLERAGGPIPRAGVEAAEEPAEPDPPPEDPPPRTERPKRTEPEPRPAAGRPAVEAAILDVAARWGLPGARFVALAACESSLRPAVRGDDGHSLGLFQVRFWPERARRAGVAGADWRDPTANATVAAWLATRGGGWGHWRTCARRAGLR